MSTHIQDFSLPDDKLRAIHAVDTYMRFPCLLDCIPIPVRLIELDDTGKPVYLYFNQTARRNSGVSLEHALGKSAAEAFPDEWGREATRQHGNVFRSGEPLAYTHQMFLAAGLRTLHTTLVPLTLEDDGKVIVIATTIDKTVQTRDESEWIRAETVHQEILRLTELAAHDLRAPLRQVMALVDLIREDFQDLGDGKLDALDMLELVSEKATSQITELLTSTKEIANASEAETFEVDVLCSDLFIMLDPLRRHNLSRDVATVLADRQATQIALRNLIDNAIKHNHPLEIDLHVGITVRESSDTLVFTVTDNGKGFAHPDKAFEEKPESRELSGLGLPAIQRMLLLRGGTIHTESSSETSGATVVMTLPGSLI